MARTAGPSLAALVLAIWDISYCLWVHFIMMAMANVITFYIKIPDHRNGNIRSIKEWRNCVREGVYMRMHITLEKWIMVTGFFSLFFLLPVLTILLPIRLRSFEQGGTWFGVVEASASIGAIIAGFFGTKHVVRFMGQFNSLILSGVLSGISIVIMGRFSDPIIFSILYFIIGFSGSVSATVGATHRLLATPQDFRVRLSATSVMVTMMAGAISPSMAGISANYFGPASTYTLYGAMIILLSSLYYLIPRCREFFNLDHNSVKDWYLREYPEAFSRSP